MKTKSFEKFVKERPWLWATKPKWDPSTTEAKVERKSVDEFIALMDAIWPEVLKNRATLWLHIHYECENFWGGWIRSGKEEVLPFLPATNVPWNWVKSFFASLLRDADSENKFTDAYTGGFVDEIVYIHPRQGFDEVLIIPKPWDKLSFRTMLLENGGWIEWRFEKKAEKKEV